MQDVEPVIPYRSRQCGALRGTVRVPGDKSISHRSLLLGALAVGETRVHGLLEGEDVLRTATAMRALGAKVNRQETVEGPLWIINGAGIGGLHEPEDVLDMGNAGTGARLLMGLLATHPMIAFVTGDGSLRKRPMERVMTPLRLFGAEFQSRDRGLLPAMVRGTADAIPIRYSPPVASAQVKSAVLLAGLNAPGETTVIEAKPTRDHTERMMRGFGADVSVNRTDQGLEIVLRGQPELVARELTVPADPSSAAFPTIAALIRPGSEVRLPGVGTNPYRFGLFETLLEMGADIAYENAREVSGEPVVDLLVRAGALRGVTVPAERAPSMIDEFPILAVAAAFAEGRTVMRGLAELRVKESDRLQAIADGLAACGVSVEVSGDDLAVAGNGAPPTGGATVPTGLDHRIAMAFLVLGMATEKPVAIDDGAPIQTSFPDFIPMMNGLGAGIEPVAD